MSHMPKKASLVSLAILLAVFFWRPLLDALKLNWLSLQTSNAILVNQESLPAIFSQLKLTNKHNCRHYWLYGLIAFRLGYTNHQQDLWSEFLNCHDTAALSLVHAGAPDNLALAQQAVRLYPDQAESWLWLAEISASKKWIEPAIQYYHRVVQLDPAYGTAWCRLGNLLYLIDRNQAKDAYLQCCYLGDPGSNGCQHAGRIEEEQGNLLEAIRIYRLSHYEAAHQRADELENQLTPTP